MPADIQPGDRVRVGGRVGDVIRVQPIGASIQYTMFFEGERPRPILVPPNVMEKISDPLDQARAGEFDPAWKFALLSQATRLSLAYEHHHLLSLSNSRTDVVHIEKQRFTQVRKGHEVVSIDPPGRYCPLYQRQHYRDSTPRWRKITRFISDERIEW